MNIKKTRIPFALIMICILVLTFLLVAIDTEGRTIGIVMCTGSMKPEYSCGDRVELLPKFEITIGSDYVYYDSVLNIYIMHRLTNITNNTATISAINGTFQSQVLIENILYQVGEKINVSLEPKSE